MDWPEPLLQSKGKGTLCQTPTCSAAVTHLPPLHVCGCCAAAASSTTAHSAGCWEPACAVGAVMVVVLCKVLTWLPLLLDSASPLRRMT